eukprot:3223912-Pleurochrysis_carterae.AAC.1
MRCKWGHPVATLPSNEGNYTSLEVGRKFCKSHTRAELGLSRTRGAHDVGDELSSGERDAVNTPRGEERLRRYPAHPDTGLYSSTLASPMVGHGAGAPA